MKLLRVLHGDKGNVVACLIVQEAEKHYVVVELSLRQLCMSC